MAQLFAITSDGHLRIGWKQMHKDLLQPNDMCIGGGEWEIDVIANRLLLSGKSHEFGCPAWGSLTQLIVPENFSGLSIYYKGNIPSEDFHISAFLNVKYL